MVHGGKRAGAGRPKGHGIYGGGVATKTMRVPANMVDDVRKYAKGIGNKVPLYTSRVAAGYPVPADDNVDEMIDLNNYLVKNPANTFCVKVSGESMIEAGIHEGDMLIADSCIEARDGQIVIAAVDGFLTVKRLVFRKDQPFLLPANPMFQAIPINENTSVHIWGVVINIIRSI